MVRLLKDISIVLCILLLVVSCSGKELFPPLDGEPVSIHHSSLLTIVECDGYTVVDVKNPWGDDVLQRYILVPLVNELPGNLPSGVVLRTPIV